MPARWDRIQKLKYFIDDQGVRRRRVEWPKGPMPLAGNEKATWVEAWVVQRRSGASQRTFQGTFAANARRWRATKGPFVQGSFRRGPAMGIALLSIQRRN